MTSSNGSGNECLKENIDTKFVEDDMLWTLTRSTGPTRLAFKRKERNENGVVWSRHLLFIFVFKMGKIK